MALGAVPSISAQALASSGNQPLTLVIRCLSSTCELLHTTVISQVLEIFLSEKGRWGTVALRLHGCGWNWSRIIDTPRSRVMECDWSDLLRVDAPNLSRLRITEQYVSNILFKSAATSNSDLPTACEHRWGPTFTFPTTTNMSAIFTSRKLPPILYVLH
jgi:hypothetical protein